MSKGIIFPENVRLIPEAREDLDELDKSQQTEVIKGILKVSKNPAPRPNGYGEPLKGSLQGFSKIKFLKQGIRVVYRHIKTVNGMFIIVISMRRDDQVYQIAEERIKKLRNNGII